MTPGLGHPNKSIIDGTVAVWMVIFEGLPQPRRRIWHKGDCEANLRRIIAYKTRLCTGLNPSAHALRLAELRLTMTDIE